MANEKAPCTRFGDFPGL